TLARGLSDGEHVAELTPQGGWGQWAVTGWVVSREQPTNWTWILGGAGIGLLVGLLAYAVSGNWRGAISVLRRTVSVFSRVLARLDNADVARVAYALTFGLAALLYWSPSTVLSWMLIALLALLIIWRLEIGLALIALA